ncbi:ATP-binding protein [Phytohabitans rumicis]|uniref:AAA+ ATPase domain-containing protein n=1 Tax=Phytohabitans rumicis TaxID=1076125 RepID=A0A6V8L166_9ACTN|nr:NB-ARC domain-containing protein [Phytohabitans rumicis]GFJ89330.1 hypothetical protein Prum_029720 [Phytohabitans rumicis]
MRRGPVIVLIAVTSGLLSVLLAVAVNVATGGTLPGPLRGVSWLAWPAVGLLGAVAVGLAIWQQHLAERELPPRAPEPAAPVRVLPPPRELPAAVTAFAGKADLAAVHRLLADGCRVLAVAGPPGAGKSTLALHVAHERRHLFPDGELFAALRGADPDPVAPEAVLAQFLDRLGAPEDERRGGLDDLAARFRSAVADRKMLIVLDNAHNAAQVRPLLPGGAGCLVLITSRRLLVNLPHAVAHPIGGLESEEARELFARAANDPRVDADPQGVARIVELCGGLPLAVRIAAARLKARPAWTPSDLAGRLENERRRLQELTHEDLAVRSSFEASYGELSDVDRTVFRRAGSHPGRVFGPSAAAALALLDESATYAALERLVDTHLVESPAPDRYRLHDLLRIFARDLLSTEDPPYDHSAYLDWLTAHAGTEDRENVVAAVRHAVERRAFEGAWKLVATVHPLLTHASDHIYRLALWQEAAIAADALGDEARKARALRWVSNGFRSGGEVTKALAPAAEAVAITERLGDRAEQAYAVVAYGEALRDLSRFDEAREALERGLALFMDLGDVGSEVGARSALGSLFNTLWQPESTVAVLEPALVLLPDVAEHRRSWVLLGLGIAYKFTGRRDEAGELIARVLDLCRRTDDEYARGYALQERGWLASEERRFDDAIQDMRASLEVFTRIRNSAGVGGAYEALGAVAANAGRHEESISACDAAIAQFERLHDRVRTGRARLNKARALADAGRTMQARAEWAAAEALIGDAPLPEVARLREHLRRLIDELGPPEEPGR